MEHKNRRILLLEDEESVSRGISFTLEKEGYHVISCGSVAEAKDGFEEFDPQLMICDITLPDGSGLEAVRYARERSSAYIICLTALDSEIHQVMGYEAGADDYITKPFSLSVLTLKIRAYFSRMEENVSDLIEWGKLKIDLTAMRIWQAGKEISLTKNEWKLLSLFLHNPGQVLSKNQILEQALDTETNFSDENTVAVNVRRLRSKIEEDSSEPKYIKNIRGLGYIWDGAGITGGVER